MNGPADLVSYPLSPAFRWLNLIKEILALHNFTLTGDWSDWEDFALMPFVDFERQHPSLEVPFNVYPTEMDLAKYTPDWTVREFFSEFMIQTGRLLSFELQLKTFKSTPFTDIIAPPPVELKEVEVVGKDYGDEAKYIVVYQQINTDELLNDTIREFLGADIETEGFIEVVLVELPIPELPKAYTERAVAFSGTPPDRANGTWIGILVSETEDTPGLFVMESAKSDLYDLSETEPLPRSLFLQGQSAINGGTLSLGMSGEGIIKKRLRDILVPLKTGRKTRLKGYLTKKQSKAIDFLRTYIHQGSRHLLGQKETIIRLGSKLHEVRLELEKLL